MVFRRDNENDLKAGLDVARRRGERDRAAGRTGNPYKDSRYRAAWIEGFNGIADRGRITVTPIRIDTSI